MLPFNPHNAPTLPMGLLPNPPSEPDLPKDDEVCLVRCEKCGITYSSGECSNSDHGTKFLAKKLW